eukprot:RCo028519
MNALQLSPVVRVVMCYTHNPYSFEGALGVLRFEVLGSPAMAAEVLKRPSCEVARMPTSSHTEGPAAGSAVAQTSSNGGGECPSAPSCSHSDFWKRLRVKRGLS